MRCVSVVSRIAAERMPAVQAFKVIQHGVINLLTYRCTNFAANRSASQGTQYCACNTAKSGGARAESQTGGETQLCTGKAAIKASSCACSAAYDAGYLACPVT